MQRNEDDDVVQATIKLITDILQKPRGEEDLLALKEADIKGFARAFESDKEEPVERMRRDASLASFYRNRLLPAKEALLAWKEVLSVWPKEKITEADLDEETVETEEDCGGYALRLNKLLVFGGTRSLLKDIGSTCAVPTAEDAMEKIRIASSTLSKLRILDAQNCGVTRDDLSTIRDLAMKLAKASAPQPSFSWEEILQKMQRLLKHQPQFFLLDLRNNPLTVFHSAEAQDTFRALRELFEYILVAGTELSSGRCKNFLATLARETEESREMWNIIFLDELTAREKYWRAWFTSEQTEQILRAHVSFFQKYGLGA